MSINFALTLQRQTVCNALQLQCLGPFHLWLNLHLLIFTILSNGLWLTVDWSIFQGFHVLLNFRQENSLYCFSYLLNLWFYMKFFSIITNGSCIDPKLWKFDLNRFHINCSVSVHQNQQSEITEMQILRTGTQTATLFFCKHKRF